MTSTDEVSISGRAFYAACDPHASDVPGDEGWPEPRMSKAGRGVRFHYPAEWAEAVSSHMREVGEGLMYGDEPETRAEGRELIRNADRVDAARPATT